MTPSTPVGATVVIPTYNESGNVAVLLERLQSLEPPHLVSEVIFVDDSSDDTPAVIRRESKGSRVRVELLHRAEGERDGGLSGAVVAGIQRASSPWVVVMDGDLQHPPEDIPRMLAATHGKDMVIASRYCQGGGAAGLADGRRRVVSRTATWLAAAMFPFRLAPCSDTMTGFFAVRRDAVDLTALRPQGFKILLEILGRHRLRVTEVPFQFAERHSGVSKARMSQGIRFAGQLARLRFDAWREAVSARALSFALIGLVGLCIDVALFNALLTVTEPLTAKLVASGVSIVTSYFLNARWTWPERRSDSPGKQLAGFIAVSAVGVAMAEACLLITHYGLGFTSRLDDNISANVFGLGLGLAWRFVAYDRWVFRPVVLEVEATVITLTPAPAPVGALTS
jgi:dolichol-phosphate mannosyltransferase